MSVKPFRREDLSIPSLYGQDDASADGVCSWDPASRRIARWCLFGSKDVATTNSREVAPSGCIRADTLV